MITERRGRIAWMLCRCSMAPLVMVGAPAFADEGWHFSDWDKDSSKVCYMYHDDRGHSVAVLHAHFAREAGVVSFVFGHEALVEPAKANEPVQLEFDTGTVRGYRLEQNSVGLVEVRMETNALKNLFAKFEMATRLDVVSSTTRVSYDLAGFADALKTLQSCTAKLRL